MSTGRDGKVWEARRNAVHALCKLISGPEADQMGQALTQLNLAWDDLTDSLIAQRNERDFQIKRLMNELAEVKARKTST